MSVLFALDNNFPEPIVKTLEEFIVTATLVPIRHIDPKLTEVEDWELIKALHEHSKPWDGLITTDDSMLNLTREICTLIQTKLTLVIAHGQGHNPVRATGILLAHLEHVCHQTERDRPQVWNLRVTQKPADDPWDQLRKIAEREGTTAKALINAYSLTRK